MKIIPLFYVKGLIFFLFLFFLSYSVSYAQSLDELLNKKDQLLSEDYDTYRIEGTEDLRNRINEHCKKIRLELNNKNLTPAQISVLKFALGELTDRLGSIDDHINRLKGIKIKPIPKDSIIAGNCRRCLEIMDNYFTSWYSKKDEIDSTVQQQFLKYLSSCFDHFSESQKYYKKAMDLIENLAFNLERVAQRVYKNPIDLDSLLNKVTDSTSIDSAKWINLLIIREIINKYADQGISFDKILNILEGLIKNHKVDELTGILEKILADSVARQENAQLYALRIHSSLDPKTFLSPLQQFINSVNDEHQLQKIFYELSNRYGTLNSTDTLAVALHQIFRNKKEDYILRQNVADVIQAMKKFKDLNSASIKVYPARRTGPSVASSPIYSLITPAIKAVWENPQSSNSSLEHLDTTNSNEVFTKNSGSRLNKIDTKLPASDQPALYIFSRHRTDNLTLKLDLRVVNDEGMILGIFHSENKMISDVNEFREQLILSLQNMKDEFSKSLIGCTQLDQLLGDFEFNVININQLKMLLLTHIKPTIRRHPKAAEFDWQEADGIFVYNPLIQDRDSEIYAGLRDTLLQRLHQRQSILQLPIYDSERTGPHNISISALAYSNNLKVLIEPNLIVNFEFSEKSAQAPGKKEFSYIADFIVESIQTYLGSHAKSSLPAYVSFYEAIPSFLFAGTSQFLLADKIEPQRPNKLKTWSCLFGGAEIAALILAGYWDKQAVEKIDNEILCRRNWALGTAAAVAITSGIHAIYKICQHNKNLKKGRY